MKKRFFGMAIMVILFIFSSNLNLYAAEQTETIELRFSLFIPLEHRSYTQGWLPWAQELERRSQGRVKVTFYPSQTLGKAKDHYNMAVTGIADIAMFVMGYTPGRFPQSEVFELPIIWPSAKIGSLVAWDIYEKYLKKEFSDVKLLQLSLLDPTHIQTVNKPVKGLADMSGLRLRTGNPQQVEIIRAWGASPINITIFDTYESLRKGMIDGVFTNYSAIRDFNLDEQLNHYTTLNVGTAVGGGAMSLKAWNSLPPDIQKIIDELSGPRISTTLGEVFDLAAKEGIERGQKRGGQFYDLSESERAAFLAKTEPITEKWIANAEKKGLPGNQIYQEVLSLVEKYSK